MATGAADDLIRAAAARGDRPVSQCIVRRAGLLLMSLLCGSCSDSNGSASQALAPSNGATVAIALPSVLKAGDSAQAGASVTDSNGDGRLVTSGWRSDAPSVASVTPSGMVTGIANGVATLSVTADGATASRTIRVVPNNHGRWDGAYRIDRCAPFPSQAYARFCDDYIPGKTTPLSITFSQNGDVVTSQSTAGGLTSVSSTSALNADGGVLIIGSNITFPFAYQFTWRLAAPASGRMAGTLVLVQSGSAGIVGGANVDATIVSLAR